MAGGRSVTLSRPSARPAFEDATAFLAKPVHFDEDADVSNASLCHGCSQFRAAKDVANT